MRECELEHSLDSEFQFDSIEVTHHGERKVINRYSSLGSGILYLMQDQDAVAVKLIRGESGEGSRRV